MKALVVNKKYLTMTPNERAKTYKKFGEKMREIKGQMLEVMFLKKDYQDEGFNNFTKYVEARLGISPNKRTT